MQNPDIRVWTLGRDVLALVSLAFSLTVFAQGSQDPAVIQMPDREVTLDEYNGQFDIAVRMMAARQGIDYNSQPPEKVSALRVQYLNQRASELAMLREADRLKLSVDEKQIDAAVAEFHHQAGDGKPLKEVLQQAGLKDEKQLRDYLREQGRIRLVTEKILEQIVVPPGDVMTLHHDISEQMLTPEVICMRQIAVADEQSAQKLKTSLNEGAAFEDLAKTHSTDKKTAEKGGDMGCFEKEGMTARSDFENAAFTATTDEVTGPIKSEFGYHLVLVYERKPPHVPSLNEIYGQLEDEIRHEKLPVVLTEIRDNSKIQTFPERLNAGAAR